MPTVGNHGQLKGWGAREESTDRTRGWKNKLHLGTERTSRDDRREPLLTSHQGWEYRTAGYNGA